ncbi:hypothetical protein TWF696_007385 [Orbilia brochopaga]|uniref:Translin n=1 Tax=Orbilia brochopaga TaxID=3140254 RepID=A0AAV9USN0_9PEZI
MPPAGSKRPHPGGGHRGPKAHPHPAAQTHGHQPDSNTAGVPAVTGPYIAMFTEFRNELDEHHDRRERVIKASRDITAASKKIIFTLQRLRPTALSVRTLPQNITAEIHTHESRVQQLLAALLPDLQGINARRYVKQYSPALQEYLEAVGFRHYLVSGEVVSFEMAGWYVSGLNADAVLSVEKSGSSGDKPPESDVEMVDAVAEGGEGEGKEGGEIPAKEEEKLHGITLTREDYVLAMFDMTGEMMRFAITSIATTPLAQLLPSTVADASSSDAKNTGGGKSTPQTLLQDLRVLRMAFESLGLGNTPFGREAEKKLEVTRQSVGKVEYAFYGMVVRGSERPEGWVADAGAAGEE